MNERGVGWERGDVAIKHYTKQEWEREQYKGVWESSVWNLDRVAAGELPAEYMADLASPALTGTPTVNGAAIATATPPAEHDFPLTSGFTKNGDCVYFKTQDGIVHCVGSVGGNFIQAENHFATLPSGFRPKAIFALPGTGRDAGCSACVKIRPEGSVTFWPEKICQAAYFSFTFVAAAYFISSQCKNTVSCSRVTGSCGFKFPLAHPWRMPLRPTPPPPASPQPSTSHQTHPPDTKTATSAPAHGSGQSRPHCQPYRCHRPE